jgi:hypothetical protein
MNLGIVRSGLESREGQYLALCSLIFRQLCPRANVYAYGYRPNDMPSAYSRRIRELVISLFVHTYRSR